MHILICDDDVVFAARVETLVRDFFALRGLQVECTVCHSGEETLARRDLDLYPKGKTMLLCYLRR